MQGAEEKLIKDIENDADIEVVTNGGMNVNAQDVAESLQNGGVIVGIIDLGSNSVRLMLVRLMPDGATSVINRVKHMVRLGENSFQTQQLQEEAIQRTLPVLASFADMCRTYKATTVLPVATAAVRDAKNGRAFIQLVREKTGLNFTIISGKEEARLIGLGVNEELPHTLGVRLFIDIGGGSTELAVASSVRHENLDSLKLGCVRLTNRFLAEHQGTVSHSRFKQMQEYVRSKASHALQRIQGYTLLEAVGSSGTALTLALLSWRLERGNTPFPNEQCVFSLESLRRTSNYLCKLTLEQRRNLPGVSARRAEVLVAGAVILQTLLEELGLQGIRTSTRNLQDGILVDYLQHQEHIQQSSLSVREHSILRLAQACVYEEKHSRHVANLALRIHDSAVDAGLIQFDHQAREHLHYAALLHDIGIFVAYSRHAAHGQYLICNSELLGFTQDEIEFIAWLVLFHSSGVTKKHLTHHDWPDSMRERLRIFSLFLAVAENLDRMHCGHVQDVFLRSFGKTIMLSVHGQDISPIERKAVEHFEKALGKTFTRNFIMNFEGMAVDEG